MYEAENFGLRRQFSECIDTRLVMSKISSNILRCDIKDKDKHFNILKDVFSL